ncbi:MAG: DUF559 domain-containing protein [bacterium]
MIATLQDHEQKALGQPPRAAERQLRQIMGRIFREQGAEVAGRAGALARSVKASPVPVLSASWDAKVAKAVRPVLFGVFKAGGDKALKSIRRFPIHTRKMSWMPMDAVAESAEVEVHSGVVEKAAPTSVVIPPWVDDPDVIEALEDELFEFAQGINQTTADALREELIEGMENGETIDQLSDRIEGLTRDWEGFRAERIARTETARAYSTGHIEAWRSTGVVDRKVWVAAGDACPFCQEMNGTVVELDENFFDQGETQETEWGGKDIEMSHDYSDVIGPPLHPNCLTDPYTPVFTERGWKPIKDVEVGQQVLTHKGRFRKVFKKHVVPRQEIVETRITALIAGKRKAQLTVTADHPVLVNGRWVVAKEIRAGQTLYVLAVKCARPGCNNWTPYMSKYCSGSCSSKEIARKQWADPAHRETVSEKNRKSMLDQYSSGNRDASRAWDVGRGNLFRLVWAGIREWPLRSPEARARMKETTNTPEQRLASSQRMKNNNPSRIPEVRRRMTESYRRFMREHPEKHPNSIMAQRGFMSGIERRMKKLLEQARIPFVQQQPILGYFADFAIPDLRIAIECDGAYWHDASSPREIRRQREIEAEGWTVLRFSEEEINKRMDEVAERVLRVAANHTGEYGFVHCRVVGVATKKRCRTGTLWNLSVEEDESFIAKGFAVHNCRCAVVAELAEEKMVRQKGGPGSGNFGHAGRPGEVGGSGPGQPRFARDLRVPEAVGWENNWRLSNELVPLQQWVEKGEMKIYEIPISKIDWESPGGLSDYINLNKVKEMAAEMKEGAHFVLPYGFQQENGRFYVSDGNHRIAAWALLGHSTVPFAGKTLQDHKKMLKGGPGSGNFGHEGRPGEVGGSGEGGGGGGDENSLSKENTIWNPEDGFLDWEKIQGHKTEPLPSGRAAERASGILDRGNGTRLQVNISDLIPTQDYTGADKVNAIASKFKLEKANVAILQQGDKLYIYDGHHTLAAAIKNGVTSLIARVQKI